MSLPMNGAKGTTCRSKISLMYLSAVKDPPSGRINSVWPIGEISLQRIIGPPPKFIKNLILRIAGILRFHSSMMSTLPQLFIFQFTCSLENVNCATRCFLVCRWAMAAAVGHIQDSLNMCLTFFEDTRTFQVSVKSC